MSDKKQDTENNTLVYKKKQSLAGRVFDIPNDRLTFVMFKCILVFISIVPVSMVSFVISGIFVNDFSPDYFQLLISIIKYTANRVSI